MLALSASKLVSTPEPFDGFSYRWNAPFRFERNVRRVPSGDQTAPLSSARSNVNRVIRSRVRSTSQTSRAPLDESGRVTAARLPSGESERSPYAAGLPTVPSCRPAVSNQIRRDPPTVPPLL